MGRFTQFKGVVGKGYGRAGGYARKAGRYAKRGGEWAGGHAKTVARQTYDEARGSGYNPRSSFRRGGRIVSGIGRSVENTAGAVTGSWDQLSWKVRGLLAFVLTFVILFVPFGIFQYAGWVLYLASTWIVNGFYWFVATIMNAILNVFIAGIDTAFRFVTDSIGGAGTYQPLESWQLTTGSLLDPDSFKPTGFDNSYLLEWIWTNFGGTIEELVNAFKRMIGL